MCIQTEQVISQIWRMMVHAHAVSTGPSFPLTLRRSGDKANYQSIYRGSNYYAGVGGMSIYLGIVKSLHCALAMTCGVYRLSLTQGSRSLRSMQARQNAERHFPQIAEKYAPQFGEKGRSHICSSRFPYYYKLAIQYTQDNTMIIILLLYSCSINL